jgi:hypothetical protein
MPNQLQDVATYQKAGLALLQNLSCVISTANTKFKNFNKTVVNNLGDTVNIALPTRFSDADSLVAVFQDVEQRLEPLTVDQAKNVSYNFTAQEFILNVEDWIKDFGRSAISQLATKVEANVAQNFVSQPFRFYGDGVTQINSYNQLAAALAMHRNFGAPATGIKGYLSDVAVPGIIAGGLNQFALERNNDIAMSWEVGKFSNCEWYQSNLLPVHTAGSEGINATTLTVVSVTKNANGGITSITFSGTNGASDADSVKENDKFQMNDGVAGQPNVRFRTFIGQEVSAHAVQFRATADAASTGASQVTVSIDPPLQAAAGRGQNLSSDIVAGMQASVLPSHRAGALVSGDALYLAMPQLPEETPFPTANEYDSDTGCSMRMYHGSQFGQNSRGMVHDCIWGSKLIPEYSTSLIFPL